MESNNENFKVYWEFQGKNQLCGLHCINSLLQGPYFDRSAMSDISSNLDEMEKKLLGEDIILEKDDMNHDRDGNYNIQVITEALAIFGVEIQPKKKKDMDDIIANSLDKVEAFVFNSTTHWFCLRKINNIWFNLNSTNPSPGPQIVSEFYLSAFIDETYEHGFTHFIVNNLPPITHDQPIQNKKVQKLVDYEEIKKSKPDKLNFGDTDDIEMEKAILESKQLAQNNNTDFHFDYKDDLQGYNLKSKEDKLAEENKYLEDEAYNMIMQESLNEYYNQIEKSLPNEPDLELIEKGEAIEISIVYNINKELKRRFLLSNTLEHIESYVKFSLKTTDSLKFSYEISGSAIEENKSISEIYKNIAGDVKLPLIRIFLLNEIIDF